MTLEGEDWKARVRAARRMKAYNDHPVQVDAETEVVIQRGAYQTSAVVLVQGGAPQEFRT